MIMNCYWKTKSFSELASEWAKKLADSGFSDVEIEINGERLLKQNSSNAFRTTNMTIISSKQAYYQLVTNSLNWDYTMTDRDKVIMTHYSEGMKQADIIKELEKGGMKCQRQLITRTITKYLQKWKIPILKERKNY